LKELCLEVYQNELVALLGHNGAGKSTLINILNGVTKSSGGRGYVMNNSIDAHMSSIH